MRMVNALQDDLSEADLAVFGIEDREEMAMLAGGDTGRIRPRPCRTAEFLAEATRHVAHARRSKHPLCLALVAFDHGTSAKGPTDMRPRRSSSTKPQRDGATCSASKTSWAVGERTSSRSSSSTADGQCCPAVLASSRVQLPDGHSFSAGLVSYQGTETIDDLVERAGECLEQAAAKGRDRTVAEGLVDLD